jgi:hypothetical protein
MRDSDRIERESALIIVRLGAIDRFAALERAFGPEGIVVIWDRRVADRRRAGRDSAVATERRRRDRRGPAPPTWSLLDFLVVPGVPRAS